MTYGDVIKTYGDVIKENLSKYPWSEYAYHFTDVTNAVNILAEGRLYSRKKALSKGLMVNDNASEKVIVYNNFVTDYVRFYFRPKTPTQFYNEGYKHPAFRFERNKNANMSIPIFFLFDLESMLESGCMKFSDKTLAGVSPAPPKEGLEEFAKLPFEQIYSKNYYDTENKVFKHAELICRDEFALEPCLKKIVCRNQIESVTLQWLLYEKNPALFVKYKDLISSDENDSLDLFERNGLFVKNFSFDEGGNLHVKFSNSPSKRYYDSRQNPDCDAEVDVMVKIGEWTANAIHWRGTLNAKINYGAPADFIMSRDKLFDPTVVKVLFDNHIAAFMLIKQPKAQL